MESRRWCGHKKEAKGGGEEVVEPMIGRDEKRLAPKLNERKEERKEEKREGKRVEERRGKRRE